MKRFIALISACILLASFCSCNDNLTEGKMIPIEPELTEKTIGPEAATFTVETKKAGWYLMAIKETTGEQERYVRNETHVVDGINIPLDTMSGSWYEVIRSQTNEITFHIATNTTGMERKLVLTITGVGMTYDDITVVQR